MVILIIDNWINKYTRRLAAKIRMGKHGGGKMAKNRHVIPEANSALDRLKFEVAREVGVELKDGYNGDILSRDAGRIGGNMVRRMIEEYEKNHADNR